jgi:hypothetical protein
MGSTSYAALPYPELPASPNVPSDVQALAARVDAIMGLALGGGSTIPGGALNLSAVPAQVTALQNTQNTQATTLATLNARPVVQQAYYSQHITSMNVASSAFSDATVQTLSVPSQTYLRLLVVYVSSTWGWTNVTTTNALRSRIKINGTTRTEAMQNGPNVTLSAFCFETVAAGATTSIVQTINCYQANQSSTAQTQEMSPIIYALLLPWFGSALTPPAA